MKIDIHIVAIGMKEDARQAIRAADLGLDVSSGRFSVAAESKAFEKILKVTQGTSGILWTPVMGYSRKDLASIDRFEVWGRRVAPESPGDSERNLATLAQSDFISTGPGLRVKLLQPIYLQKLKGKPNEALRLAEWAEEYILGSAVKQAFEDERLCGYRVSPVLKTKDESPFEGFWQIFTEHLLPPAISDLSVLDVKSAFEERPWWKRKLGSLTYDQEGFPSDSDFHRTAEPWGANSLPLWIVSKKVVECFEGRGLKGWSFLPVLWQDSQLYEKYLEHWERLFQMMSSNPGNRLW